MCGSSSLWDYLKTPAILILAASVANAMGASKSVSLLEHPDLQDPVFASEVFTQIRLEAAKRCAVEGDVLGWGKALMPSKFPLSFCSMHEYLVAVRKTAFTSTESPRGSAKTTVGCVLLPLYQGLVEPNAFKHYLNVQSNADKALTINRAIKMEIEQNPLIKKLYGDQIGERWTDACFVLKNGVVYSAEGYGASIRGLNYRGLRPDYAVLDDFYDSESEIYNPNGTVKKNEWFWGTLYPILAQDRPTAMHLQGTAVNREDLFEKLKSDKTVTSKTFKAVLDWEKGTVLWPGLKTIEQYETMRKRMGTLIFSREFQNERRDDSSSIVKMSWLYPDDGTPNWEYDPTSLRFNENFLFQAAIITLDPSIGSKKHSDKSGYALVIRAQNNDGSLPVYYIEALANELHSFQQRIDHIKSWMKGRPAERPITRVRVEAIAGFKDIGERVAANVSVPCDIVDHVPNKLTHLERHSAIFENKRIFLNKAIDPALKTELAYQLTTNLPKNDDLRDGVLLGLDSESANWSSWVL